MLPNGQRLTPLEMLAKLVSFDTVSSKSNLPLIAFVEDYLQGWNVPYVRVPNEAGDKAAIYATVGPQDRGGIVLSGHTDVVPVVGQAWTSDPFTLRVENGRAYGRGAVDMKAFDALALAMVPEFLTANLKTPIHIMLSYDEETTCL
ncbi:MAG: M20/M25/M40 family metallo-hydrolase, partial [Pseudomonadota bacterium]|nr:M20/M25/M40 family metallo-hydrolase [Pseudomonadota bacterium]